MSKTRNESSETARRQGPTPLLRADKILFIKEGHVEGLLARHESVLNNIDLWQAVLGRHYQEIHGNKSMQIVPVKVPGIPVAIASKNYDIWQCAYGQMQWEHQDKHEMLICMKKCMKRWSIRAINHLIWPRGSWDMGHEGGGRRRTWPFWVIQMRYFSALYTIWKSS